MPIVAAGTAPPKRPTPRTSGATKPATVQGKINQRAEDVDGLFKMAAAACIMKGLYADAGAINVHSPNISREMAKLAEENAQVAKLIDYLTSAGPYSGILIAVLPFALQIAANHGRIDVDKAAGLGGVMSAKDLEDRVKAELEHQRAEFQKEIREMQADNARQLASVAPEAAA
jgi:hypothetical protein